MTTNAFGTTAARGRFARITGGLALAASVLGVACAAPTETTASTSQGVTASECLEEDVATSSSVATKTTATETLCAEGEDCDACPNPGPPPPITEADYEAARQAAGYPADLFEEEEDEASAADGSGLKTLGGPNPIRPGTPGFNCITSAWRAHPIRLVWRLSISACGWVLVDANAGDRAGALALCSVIVNTGCAGLLTYCSGLRPAPGCITSVSHPYSVCMAAHIAFCS